MSITRRISGVFLILASLIGANLFMSQSAQAAATAISCSGSVTARYYANYPGVGVVGELIVYYNSTNGGTNSACLYHRGPASGVAGDTNVEIRKCSQTSGEGRSCTMIGWDGDRGNYSSYAGPVGVTGTANNCVSVRGWVEYRGVLISASGADVTVGC
ncbi:hypothetical protein [Streptomyces tendae]